MDTDDKHSHDEPRFDHIDKWYVNVYTDLLCATDRPLDVLAVLLSGRYLGFK